MTAGSPPAVQPAMPAGQPSARPAPSQGAAAPARPIGRIRVRRDFLAANSGIRVPMPAFILLVKPAGQPVPRVGFTVSRKVGNAVARNRARRRLREVARLALPELGLAGADHVFIARPMPQERAFDQLLADARTALGRAARRMAAPPEAAPER